MSVGKRALPGLLAVTAAFADGRGAHRLALDLLLVALPLAAVAALAAFGRYLDRRDDPVVALQGLLCGVVLVLLLASCEIRSNAVEGVPQLAASTLAACIGVMAIKASLAAAPSVRRLVSLRPAKP